MERPRISISRKNLFRLGAAGTLTAAVGREAHREIDWKIATDTAVFYPFYEDHRNGIWLDPEKLPQTLDFHWVEHGIWPSLREKYPDLDMPINEWFITVYKLNYEGKIAGNNLKLLASKNTAIAFGDIEIPEESDESLIKRMRLGEPNQLLLTYLAVRGAKIGWQEAKKRLRKNPGTPARMTRRELLARTILTGLDLTAVYFTLNSLIMEPLTRAKPALLPPPEAALERIKERIAAMMMHTRPADLVVFFRNLIFAHKQLYLAEVESKRLRRQVHISYQIGGGHAGVEDFLILGKGFCEKLIGAYYPQLLAAIIEENRSLDNFTYITKLKPNPESAGLEGSDWSVSETLFDEDLKRLVLTKIAPDYLTS